MTKTGFLGPKLKLERAWHHIGDLANIVHAYRKSAEVTFGPYDPATRTRVIRFSPANMDEASCILGDAIHNLRAAMDLLVCGVAKLKSASSKDLLYPFAIDEPRMEARIVKMNLSKIDPALADLIRSTRPYRGGNDILRALHELDIKDKHELLVPVYLVTLALQDENQFMTEAIRDAMVGRNGFSEPVDPTGEIRSAKNIVSLVRDGRLELVSVMGAAPYLVEYRDGDVADMASDRDPSEFLDVTNQLFSLRFDNDAPHYAAQGVLETLNLLACEVGGVVDQFDATYFR